MNVYADPKHIATWRRTGRFPEIHADIAAFVAENRRGRRALDLCCSIGILGAQLARHFDFVLGVDEDAGALEEGRTAGIAHDLVELRVGPATLPEFEALLRQHEVDTVVARRCLPEMLGADLDFARDFAEALAAGGVRDLFIEGRKSGKNATHALSNVEAEIAAVAPPLRLLGRRKECAWLAC